MGETSIACVLVEQRAKIRVFVAPHSRMAYPPESLRSGYGYADSQFDGKLPPSCFSIQGDWYVCWFSIYPKIPHYALARDQCAASLWDNPALTWQRRIVIRLKHSR